MEEVERAIVERVRRDAATWFPGVPPDLPVHLRTLSAGRRSRVYVVSLGEPPAAPLLVAKARNPHSALGQGPARRPTLATAAAGEDELTEGEYAGLGLLAATFPEGDPRFGAVRPLAHLPEHHTILMRHITGESVRDLLLRTSRLRPPWSAGGRPVGLGDRHDPESVLPAVGSWLRRFHDATPVNGYPARQPNGRDVVAHFAALEEFLARRLGRRFGDLAGAGSALASEVLPPGPLPLAVGHGDFAPRNALVDGAGRLVVFDPMVRWAAPEHEDLCRFLVGVRLLGLQLHSHGAAFDAATIEHWEDLVIAGYHPGRVPLARLRCHQLLMLLDKWSALLEPAAAGGLRATGHRLLQEAAAGYVRAQAERLIALARSADR